MKTLPLSKLQKLDARRLEATLLQAGEPVHITTHLGVVAVVLRPGYYRNLVEMANKLDELVKRFMTLHNDELHEAVNKLQGDKDETI